MYVCMYVCMYVYMCLCVFFIVTLSQDIHTLHTGHTGLTFT